MSENVDPEKNNEIDLEKVYLKFNNSLKRSLVRVYDFLLFLKRNSLYLILIFLLCTTAGFFLDKKGNTYTSEIFLKSNFDNVDYLYSKIDAINSKVIQQDSIFLKKNNLNIKNVIKVEIKPIEDPFNFVSSKNDKAFELLKLFAEENDISKVISDKNFYKNYSNHTIIITSNTPINFKEVYKSIINYLNNNQYYEDIKVIIDQNTKDKIEANKLIIAQIDDIISNANTQKDSTSTNIVMVGENSKLSDLLHMKEELINENQNFNFTILNNTSVFKIISIDIENLKQTKHLFILIFPILGLVCFFFFAFMKAVIRTAKSYKKNEI